MSKNRQKKKDKKLRQSIEVLKAQLKIEPEAKSVQSAVSTKKLSEVKINYLDDRLIKRDLTKTLVLSALGFAVIILLWSFDITGFRF